MRAAAAIRTLVSTGAPSSLHPLLHSLHPRSTPTRCSHRGPKPTTSLYPPILLPSFLPPSHRHHNVPSLPEEPSLRPPLLPLGHRPLLPRRILLHCHHQPPLPSLLLRGRVSPPHRCRLILCHSPQLPRRQIHPPLRQPQRWAVFNQVPPNVSAYTTMIRGYCKLGLMADAETLFLNMACRPNLVTYNTLLQGYSMKGMMDSATATLAMMMRTQDCSPDVITFTTLINGFSRIGKTEKARALLEEMIERWNLKPNLVTYNAVISGLCAKEEFEKCLEMMARMRLDGIKPDVVTYSCMVKGLCAAGRVDEAAARLREMAAMAELELDSMAYGPVVKGYCKAGRLDEAMGVLDEMRKRSITPHVSLFNTLVAALVEISEVEKAAWLVKEMRRRGCKPSFLSYGFVVRGFCKRVGGMARAEALVVAMRHAGHCPDRRMYLDLADGYCREGDMGMVEKVLGDAAKEGFVPQGFDEMPASFRC